MGNKQSKQTIKTKQDQKQSDPIFDALFKKFSDVAVYQNNKWEANMDISPKESRILCRGLYEKYPKSKIISKVDLFAPLPYMIIIYPNKEEIEDTFEHLDPDNLIRMAMREDEKDGNFQ